MKLLNDITPLEKDFTKWYTDVVIKGNMIQYGKSQGSMIFKPISYGIWENIRSEVDAILKKKFNSENVSMPLLIPLSYIEKEKEHIKGFAPELATITKVGKQELDEHLIIRPTSEVLFTELFAKEISSYKDLPIFYNQWANVLRWEKKTRPFLRNREFMWHEMHTAHSNSLEARRVAKKAIKVYYKFLRDYLAIPAIIGKKTPREKFAGAVTTYTIEAMMKDGKALQSGTSHYLGQSFAKSFKAEFKNKNNEKEFIYQTSFGISTRLIGAIIMSHGDNRGVIIPPKIAPNQIDIIEIFGHKNEAVRNASKNINKILKRKYRTRVDDSEKGPGHKAAQSEIEGTPLRIEVGPRDLENNMITIVRRDTLEKKTISINDVKDEVGKELKEIQSNLLKVAENNLNKNIFTANTFDEFEKLIKQQKFVIAHFAGVAKDEEMIQNKFKATARCILMDKSTSTGKCIITGKETKRRIIFARAY